MIHDCRDDIPEERFDRFDDTLADEINRFPPGACPCLVKLEYTDTEPFSGTLDIRLDTVHGEYLIRFPEVAAYFARTESYAPVEPEAEYTGGYIREFTKSCFLDVMNKMSFADKIRSYRHYGVYTENTVFDIAAFRPPEITKVSSKDDQ